jgi:hypothetical protein
MSTPSQIDEFRAVAHTDGGSVQPGGLSWWQLQTRSVKAVGAITSIVGAEHTVKLAHTLSALGFGADISYCELLLQVLTGLQPSLVLL